MEQSNDDLEHRRRPDPIVKVNWISLVGNGIAFLILLPLLTPTYIYTIHNPVDAAIIAFFGVPLYPLVLYLCIIVGGVIGLLLSKPLRRWYNQVLSENSLYIGYKQILLIGFGSLFGYYWYSIISMIWNLICPYTNTGFIVTLFIGLPAITYGICAAAVNLFEFRRANRMAAQKGLKLQFSYIKWQRHSRRLELVPVDQ